MNGSKIFIDTNICIYLLNGNSVLAELLQDQEIFISTITEMELYVYHTSEAAGSVLKEFIESVTVVEINQRVKQLTIDIRRRTKIKLPDSIIAASALMLDMSFISADKSFKRAEELDWIYFKPLIDGN